MQVNSCLSDTLYKPPMRYSPYSHWQYPQDNQDKLIDLCCFDTDPLDKKYNWYCLYHWHKSRLNKPYSCWRLQRNNYPPHKQNSWYCLCLLHKYPQNKLNNYHCYPQRHIAPRDKVVV